MTKTENKNNSIVQEDKELKRTNVVAALQELQAQEGFLPKEKMIAMAREKKMPGVNVFGVATFYSQFKMAKPGKYLISVCSGTACHIKRSDTILSYVEELLDIKKSEMTKDGKFSLECVNCIGACAKAPAMMINETVYGELTKEKTKKIIEGLK